MKTIRMEEMTWPDIKSAMENGYRTVVVAIGSTEQHGPHLPTGTDTLIGDDLAYRVAVKLGNALHGRTINVGCSGHHLAFPGTISLEASTLKKIILDYVSSLSGGGFKKIVFLPSHGGNFPTVKDAVNVARKKFQDIHITGYTDLIDFIKVLYDASGEFGIGKEEAGAHAGENETSIILALREDLVARDKFTRGYLGPLGEKEIKKIIEKGMPALTEIGVLGDPRKASATRGEVYLKRMTDFLVEWLKNEPSSAS